MPRERSLETDIRSEPDSRVARLAARQWGVLSRDELFACGLSKSAIQVRVATERLFPLYRGVFTVGHANAPREAWCLAAVKACGPGAALSHWAAAVLWEPARANGRYPDVIAPTIKRHVGINTHRADTFDATTHRGIPVTTPAQTIIHLSAVADVKTLRRAVNEALNRRLITLRDLITHNHRGAKQLRAVLATAAPTRSENENAVLALLHDAGIPKPLVNPAIDGTNLIPDFLWPDKALVLETDSWRYHDHLLARADDRTQDKRSSKPSATASSVRRGPRSRPGRTG